MKKAKLTMSKDGIKRITVRLTCRATLEEIGLLLVRAKDPESYPKTYTELMNFVRDEILRASDENYVLYDGVGEGVGYSAEAQKAIDLVKKLLA